MTAVTATPMPRLASKLADTPKKMHRPRKRVSTKLLTSTADRNSSRYSPMTHLRAGDDRHGLVRGARRPLSRRGDRPEQGDQQPDGDEASGCEDHHQDRLV